MGLRKKLRSISLSKGKFAVVDDSDFERVSQYKWYVEGWGYAVRNHVVFVKGKKTRRHQYMHRFILGLGTLRKDPIEVDHKDGDTLNNSRSNLRLAPKGCNARNRKNNGNSRIKYKGVYMPKGCVDNPYSARVTVRGVSKVLGYFKTAKEAALAYDREAKKLHGKFARLNFGGASCAK